MLPELFGISLYRPTLLIAVLAGIALHLVLVRREGLPVGRTLLFILVLFPFALGGAKLYSVWERGHLWSLPFELMGGLRYPGAILGLLVGALLLRRFVPAGVSLGRWGDLFAPAFALMLGIGRLGCVFSGCCFGVLCHLPWGMRFPAPAFAWYLHREARLIPADGTLSLPVHPLPVYFMILELGLMVFALWFLRRKSYDGQVALVCLAVHGPVKFSLEYLRDPYSWVHQPVPLLLGLAAIAALVRQWMRRRRDAAFFPAP